MDREAEILASAASHGEFLIVCGASTPLSLCKL